MPINIQLPSEAGRTVEECYRFCLSQRVSTQVVGVTSMEQLKQDLALARHFKPMTAADAVTICSRTARCSTARTTASGTGLICNRRRRGNLLR